jgi:DNA protecting protein DprA
MTPKHSSAKSKTEAPSEATQARVGVKVDELAAIYVLDRVKGFGPAKFKSLFAANVSYVDAVRAPDKLPIPGKLGDDLRVKLRSIDRSVKEACFDLACRQIATAERHQSRIFTYTSLEYPQLIFESNNPVLPLYARGNVQLLPGLRSVACVGSRRLREPYRSFHSQAAAVAASLSLGVVSGFATGADILGHEAAVDAGGFTICCMPSGLDRPFPPENRAVWQRFLALDSAVFITEFPFGAPASALRLRKRNKLIVACSRGVLISQSAADGGAMNAYRFARMQKKPVATFAADGSPDTTGNQQIAEEQKESDAILAPANRVFPNDHFDEETVKLWFLELSSSI